MDTIPKSLESYWDLNHKQMFEKVFNFIVIVYITLEFIRLEPVLPNLFITVDIVVSRMEAHIHCIL